MSDNEHHLLQRLTESEILVHQLQRSLSEATTAKLHLSKELENRIDELHECQQRLRDRDLELVRLTDDYQALLENRFGDTKASQLSETRASRGSLFQPVKQVESQWVQTSDALLPIPADVQGELDQLRYEVEVLRKQINADIASSDVSTGSGDLRSGSDDDYGSDNGTLGREGLQGSMAFAQGPRQFALKLNLPPAIAEQASGMVTAREDLSNFVEETPRYTSRVHQPLNLTQILSTNRRGFVMATPRLQGGAHAMEATSASRFVQQTPRGAAGSINSIMSPRLHQLAGRMDRLLPSASNRASIAEPPSQHLEVTSDAYVPPLALSKNRRHTAVHYDVTTTSEHAPTPDVISSLHVAEGASPAPLQLDTENVPSPPDAPCVAAVPDSAFHRAAEEPVPQIVVRSEPPTAEDDSGHGCTLQTGVHSTESKADFLSETTGPICHMFGLPDENASESFNTRCSVCELMDAVKDRFGSRMTSHHAYLAAGWLPEIVELWRLEHEVVWTVEERVSLITTVSRPPQLKKISPYHLATAGKLWRKTMKPWKSNWKDVTFVLQGVFLYIFDSDRPSADAVAMAVAPIRGAQVSPLPTATKPFGIEIICNGCEQCVEATENQYFNNLHIAFKDEHQYTEWLEALKILSGVCPHMCSSKFANNVTPLRQICEALIAAGIREERRAILQQAKRLQRQGTTSTIATASDPLAQTVAPSREA